MNPRLSKPKSDFVEIMKNLNLPYPKQIGKFVDGGGQIIHYRAAIYCYYNVIMLTQRVLSNSNMMTNI